MLWISEEGFSSKRNVCNISSFVTLTLCAVVGFLHGIDALDWGIAHSLRLWTRSIPSFVSGSPVSCSDSIPSFVSGSPASCSDSIPSFVSGSLASCLDLIPLFCFGFSGIAPEFYPFLFRVLRHCTRIRSLHFISISPASRPDSILFCLGFSRIVSKFDPFVLFQFLQHRTWIPSLHFVSISLTSRSNSIP